MNITAGQGCTSRKTACNKAKKRRNCWYSF